MAVGKIVKMDELKLHGVRYFKGGCRFLEWDGVVLHDTINTTIVSIPNLVLQR